jgi:hypothetical protein
VTADYKKYGSTLLMIFLGMLALYGGVLWLPVLVPAAALVWYGGSRPTLGGSRN